MKSPSIKSKKDQRRESGRELTMMRISKDSPPSVDMIAWFDVLSLHPMA